MVTDLGCAQSYAVRLLRVTGRDSGGPVQLSHQAALTASSGLVSVDWHRRLSELSEANFTLDVTAAGAGCLAMLDGIDAWSYEARIYRDQEPVWEGPVEAFEESSAGEISFECVDGSAWLARGANLQTMRYANSDVENIAAAIVRFLLTDPDYSRPVDYPIMLDYLTQIDSTTLVDYRPGLVAEYVMDTLEDLRQYGLDWTTLGRSLILSRRASATARPVARLTTDCFDGGLTARRDGSDVATYGWAVKGGSDDAPPVMVGYGATGSPYGRHDRIVTVSDGEATTATMRTVARQAISGRTRPVTQISMPTSAKLTPAAPVKVADLVCGRRFDVFFQGAFTRVRQASVLSAVDGSWVPGDEQIKVGLTGLGGVTDIDPAATAAQRGEAG